MSGLASTKPGEKPTDINTQVAVAVVDALTPLNRLKQVNDGTLPDTPAVLIKLARAEYDATLAASETARLRKESDIVAIELAAMINEVNLLKSAMKEKDTTKVLRRYSDSWTMGRLQQDVAAYDIQNLKYEASLVREKAAIMANHKLLTPALVQLDTYARASAYKFQAEKMTFSLKSSFKAALNRFFLMLILEGSFFSRLIAS